jgi:small conductance mechanosensitive channel
VREFRRRVRLALEAHHLLPGDPNRVFKSFGEQAGDVDEVARRRAPEPAAQEHDPTTLKPQESNPFTGE